MTTSKKIYRPELQTIEPIITVGQSKENFRKNNETWIVNGHEWRQSDNRGYSRKNAIPAEILDYLLSKVVPEVYYPERRGSGNDYTIEAGYNGESLSTIYNCYHICIHYHGEHIATFEFRQNG